MPPPTGSARRYADALFSIARERDTIDAWAAELASLRALASTRQGLRVLESPDLSPAQKRRAVEAAVGPLSRETAALLDLLLRRKRARLLPALAEAYEERVRAHRGIALAVVTTAVPLDQADRELIARWLRARLSRQVEIREQVDPEIIGGVVVRVGDQLIDASVRGRLERLRRRLRGDLRDELQPAY